MNTRYPSWPTNAHTLSTSIRQRDVLILYVILSLRYTTLFDTLLRNSARKFLGGCRLEYT